MRYLIYFFFFITFGLPIVLVVSKSSFTTHCFVNYIEDFSIPLWLTFFSASWLYYKKAILDNQHLSKESIENEQSPEVTKMVIERNNRIEPRIRKRRHAEQAIKSVEIATVLAGLILGILGLISFLTSNMKG